MKTNCWLVLGTMVATTAVAQVNTNKLPELPAPAAVAPAAPAVPAAADAQTNAPAKHAAVKHKKPVKKSVAKTESAEKTAKAEKHISTDKLPELTAPLVAGPATVAVENANLRGQAGLKGEVIGHAKKGDTLTVISEIALDKAKADEPARWAKVALPTGTKVWVNTQFIDATNKVVTARKLNLRAGPGENYSVVGLLEKGATVAPVSTKAEWTEIEAPTSAFAFVAANLLKQDASAVAPAVTATTPPPMVEPVVPTPAPTPVPVVTPTPTPVVDAQPVIAQPQPVPTPAPVVTPAPVTPPVVTTPALVIDTNTASIEDTNPPPPRIVTHEGYVRSSVSPVAPTYFELYDPVNDKAINYLFSATTNLDLGRYEGLHINVTGEEGLEKRWKDTPVITVQKIYVLSTNAPAKKAKFHLW